MTLEKAIEIFRIYGDTNNPEWSQLSIEDINEAVKLVIDAAEKYLQTQKVN